MIETICNEYLVDKIPGFTAMSVKEIESVVPNEFKSKYGFATVEAENDLLEVLGNVSCTAEEKGFMNGFKAAFSLLKELKAL